MDRASHVYVHQANELEISGDGKCYGIGLQASSDIPIRSQNPRIHACRLIEARPIWCVSGTSDREPEGRPKVGRPCLAGLEERYGMNFRALKVPADAVVGMYPQLVRQECQSLTA